MTCTFTPVSPVFAGVVRSLVGDSVDRDEGAVQDRVREGPDACHRGGQVAGDCGEQGDRFLDVAPGGRDADLEPGGEAGVSVAVAQMGQGEQCLTAWVEAPPSGSMLVAVLADAMCEVVEGVAGQRNRGGVRQDGEAPGRGIGSWSTAVLPGASPSSVPGPATPVPSCNVSLEVAHCV